MYLFIKIGIICIILFASIVLWKLCSDRQILLNEIITNKNGEELAEVTEVAEVEGMTTEETNEVNKITAGNSTAITTISSSNTNFPLREYCIKSSYNSAYSGHYVNVETIGALLTQGVRFLDFEIFSINDEPHVGVTNDPTLTTFTSKNTILLTDVLRYIVVHGFSIPSPNLGDPLFIHLRIKTKDKSLFEKVAMGIDITLKNRLYKGRVSGNTKLSNLMGKIVLIVDKKVSSNYEKYPVCPITTGSPPISPCYNLSKYTSMESGGDILRSYTYASVLDQVSTPPHIHDDNKTSDVSLFKMVFPEDITTSGNPNIDTFIGKYGIQIVTYRFYIHDSYLKLYEEFFQKGKSAFILFADAMERDSNPEM